MFKHCNVTQHYAVEGGGGEGGGGSEGSLGDFEKLYPASQLSWNLRLV